MARTNLQDSEVQERTVSVLPSRKSRVMEASYVRQNLPISWGRECILEVQRVQRGDHKQLAQWVYRETGALRVGSWRQQGCYWLQEGLGGNGISVWATQVSGAF